MHFVKKTFQSSVASSSSNNNNGNDINNDGDTTSTTTTTIVFRWMEQDESTLWEILGVWKACLSKGILSTRTCGDLERLAGLWIRSLRGFGASSGRLVRRILGLVENLLEHNNHNKKNHNNYGGEAALKRILHREGFLEELVVLSRRWQQPEVNGEGETIRTEIEAVRAKLR